MGEHPTRLLIVLNLSGLPSRTTSPSMQRGAALGSFPPVLAHTLCDGKRKYSTARGDSQAHTSSRTQSVFAVYSTEGSRTGSPGSHRPGPALCPGELRSLSLIGRRHTRLLLRHSGGAPPRPRRGEGARRAGLYHLPARGVGGGGAWTSPSIGRWGGAAGFGRRVNSASPPLPPARLGAPGEAPPPARAHTRTHTETRARCPVSIVKPPGTLRARRRPPKHGAASWEWPAPPELPAPRRPRREGLRLRASGVKVRGAGRRVSAPRPRPSLPSRSLGRAAGTSPGSPSPAGLRDAPAPQRDRRSPGDGPLPFVRARAGGGGGRE